MTAQPSLPGSISDRRQPSSSFDRFVEQLGEHSAGVVSWSAPGGSGSGSGGKQSRDLLAQPVSSSGSSKAVSTQFCLSLFSIELHLCKLFTSGPDSQLRHYLVALILSVPLLLHRPRACVVYVPVRAGQRRHNQQW